jgi:hypothetical protein
MAEKKSAIIPRTDCTRMLLHCFTGPAELRFGFLLQVSGSLEMSFVKPRLPFTVFTNALSRFTTDVDIQAAAGSRCCGHNIKLR